MNISVVICSYNRCDDLQRTLETLCKSVVPAECKWELLVLDNNSQDNTKSVCQTFQGRMPLHYIFEAQQGKSCALNRAIKEATGDLLLFTDDDVDITEEWISEYFRAAERNPTFMYFGGKVLSSWQGKPPQWFIENSDWLQGNPSVNWGDEQITIAHIDKRFFLGANIGIRRAVFDEGLRYNDEIGPKGQFQEGNARHGAEELDIQRKILLRGQCGLYLPTAIVYHRDPIHRMTEKYLRYYYAQMGEMDAFAGNVEQSAHLWFGVPRYLWRKLIQYMMLYFATRWISKSRIWLNAEIKAARTFGEIRGFRRRYKSGQLRFDGISR